MKLNRLFLFFALASLAGLLSACGAQPATNWPGVTTNGELIFLSSGQHVYTVQASDGLEVSAGTRFPLEADANHSLYAPVALGDDGLMLVGNASQANHDLFAVDSATGTPRWTFSEVKLPWIAGALTLDGNFYAPAGDGNLYSFSADGQLRWKQELSEHALWTKPVTDGSSVYLATLDHVLYSLQPETGAKNWQKEVDNGIVGAPALADGTLYFGTLSGTLYALNAQTGDILWQTQLDGNIWGTPALDGETLYIGTVYGSAGKFYALNAQTGVTAWVYEDEGSIIAGALVLPDQVIYVTEKGRVQSMNKQGVPVWQQELPKNKIYVTPIQIGDSILVTPMGSEFLMVAYNFTGAQKWTFTPAK